MNEESFIPPEVFSKGVERRLWAEINVMHNAKLSSLGVGIFTERIGDYDVLHVAVPHIDPIWFLVSAVVMAALTIPTLSLLRYIFRSRMELLKFNHFVRHGNRSGWDTEQWVKGCTLWLGHSDHVTLSHVLRMEDMTEKFGKFLGWTQADIDTARRSAGIHDMGKRCIQMDIVNKPGKLTAVEYIYMQEHVGWSERLLNRITALREVATIIGQHHEFHDGTGYPRKLKGNQISIIARALSIADAYDCIVNARPYKPPVSKRWALWELRRCAGTQFDPVLVEKFIDFMGVKEVDIEEPERYGEEKV